MLYLGIDLHAKQFTVNLRDENGEILQRRPHRTPEGERNTRLVRLVQILSRCGWKEFFHTGKTSDTNCSPDHDEKGTDGAKDEPVN